MGKEAWGRRRGEGGVGKGRAGRDGKRLCLGHGPDRGDRGVGARGMGADASRSPGCSRTFSSTMACVRSIAATSELMFDII